MDIMAWQPHPEMNGEMTAHGYRYENRTLLIVFADEDHKVRFRMTFHAPMVFRCTDELNLHAYDEGFVSHFNILKKSAYLDWFRQLSGCETLNERVLHYAMFTWSDCFEVIAMEPPIVTWEVLDPKHLDNPLPPPWTTPV